MNSIDQITLYHYCLPLRDPLPLKGTKLIEREGIIVELQSGGCYGYGEAAPLPDFSHESMDAVGHQLAWLADGLMSSGRCLGSWLGDGLGDSLPSPLFPSVEFAMSSALWMLRTPQQWPVPEVAPLLQGSTDDIIARLNGWSVNGPAEFKLKVGKEPLKTDIHRIQTIIGLLPDHSKLRLDANQRWCFSEALSMARQLDPARIVYMEEPTGDCSDFTTLYEMTGIPFALDETIQHRNYRYRKQDGLAAIVIKPTLVGGLERCRMLVNAGRSDGVRTVFSSAFESTVGMAVLQQLSAQWTPLEQPGLDTSSAFADSLVNSNRSLGRAWSFNADRILSTRCF